MLGQAFDQAWAMIAADYSTESIDDRRTRLAMAILELAERGERNPDAIVERALRRMRSRRLSRPPP